MPISQQVDKSALYRLMQEVFNDEEELKEFLFINFTDYLNQLPINGGLSTKNQGLINHCERYGHLPQLILAIKHKYPIKYMQFEESLFNTHVKPEASLVIKGGIVELNLLGELDLVSPNIDDFLRDFRFALVNYLGVNLEEITIIQIRKGSIIIKAIMSGPAIEKLSNTTQDVLEKEFGIKAYSILSALQIRIDLRDADMERANLDGTDFRGADLRGANLHKASLVGAIFRSADLRRTDLSNTNLRGIDLRGANLEQANLQGADLRGANLEEANLAGANLERANLFGTDISHVIYDINTKWPFDADLRDYDLQL